MQDILSDNTNNVSFKSKTSCFKKCFQCEKKLKKPKSSSESELKSILQKNKNLFKFDNSQIINNQSINSPFRLNKRQVKTEKKVTATFIAKNPSNLQSKIRYKNTLTNEIFSINKVEKPEKHFFHEFKDKLRCLFCGGKKCKHENYKNNILNNNAIEGLNSNFITEKIIASQRPSEVLIHKYHLIQKFKILNIGLIVNLQREGEHPYCGPNAHHLTSAGYSYNPSVFTGDDIKCKFSGWKDMEIPSSMNFMLDIVKEMSIVTNDQNSKVLVHCHAGYGRTGVVIVCYLLFNSIKDSDTIIKEVRQKRKKCVETKSQISYCKKFEGFLNNARIIFGNKDSIDVYLRRQEDLLYGNEYFKYGFVPKIIVKVLNKIMDLRNNLVCDKITIYKVIEGIVIEWNDELENELLNMKNLLNKGDWDYFDRNNNLIVVVELLFDWFEDCVEFIINRERTKKIISSDLFCEYIFIIKDNKKNYNQKLLSQQRKNLFDYIKKIYHCFEYEIIFNFATFLTTIPPNNKEEKKLFNSMIDRISIGLLGFSYSNANNINEYNNSIYYLYSGLSSIIKLICDSFLKNSVEESFSILSPIRKNCPVKYNLTIKEQIPYILTTESIVLNDRRKSYILPRAINTILSNPGITINPKNFVTPKHNVNKTVVRDNYDNLCQVLQNQYSSKNDESEFPSSYINSPSEIPSLGEDLKKNFTNYLNFRKNLGKVVEEANSKNSYSINSASIIDKSNNNFNNSNAIINGKYNDSNMVLNFETMIKNKNKNQNKKKNKKFLTISTTENKKNIFKIFNEKKRNLSVNFINTINNNNNNNKNNNIKMRKSMLNKQYNNFLSDKMFKSNKIGNDDNLNKKNSTKQNNEYIIQLKKCI